MRLTQEQQYDAAHALAARNKTTVGRWPEDARIEAERAARVSAQVEAEQINARLYGRAEADRKLADIIFPERTREDSTDPEDALLMNLPHDA